MSRTDKDRPYVIRAADDLEQGRYASHWHTARRWQRWHTADRWAEDGLLMECDLGEHPYAHWRSPDADHCTWSIAGWAYAPYRHSTPEARRVQGHKPHRARARRRVEELRREFNAHGELEDGDVFSPQHRHSVDWLWA